MTLPQPTAVAAAFSGHTPTDVREWISVDIVGIPSKHRRGYAVLVEPQQPDGRSNELSTQIREILMRELRSHPQQAPDAVLARAFGIANNVLLDEARITGVSHSIGAVALIFQDNTATIAHVPPGQFLLIQDHLVYGVPGLIARTPYWAEPEGSTPTPEPLGFAEWTAPILVQTELMPGDTLVLCNDATGSVLASDEYAVQGPTLDLSALHGNDPDTVLDELRETAVSTGQPFFAAVVIAFPPNPTTSGIESLHDVAVNAREQVRHARAAVQAVLPTFPTLPTVRSSRDNKENIAEGDISQHPPAPRLSFQERVIRLTEGRSPDTQRTWKPRREEALFGAPSTHGVRKHRRKWLPEFGPEWKTGAPRAPFITSPVFYGGILIALFLLGMLVWSQRDVFLPNENVWAPALAQVDQRISAIGTMTDPVQIRSELGAASKDLLRAEQLGAPGDQVRERRLAIVSGQDELDNVYRVSNLQRIGSLPDQLRGGRTSALYTDSGIFLVNGNLYRLDPETAQILMMLDQGREIKDIRVGELFGVAYDGRSLVVTDGKALFFASSLDGAYWQAMRMEEINNQGPWPTGPISAFNGNMYLLESKFRNIYSFTLNADELVVAPSDWVSVGDRVNLNKAVDMAIDGNIYVLLSDGQVITFRSRLEIKRFDVPGFDYNTEHTVAIVNGATTGYLYVAIVDDEGDGRVIAVDGDGQNAVIMELPVDFTASGNDMQPFEGLQDMAVNEDAGILFLINGDAIWSFSYTLPVLPGAPNATPVASEGN